MNPKNRIAALLLAAMFVAANGAFAQNALQDAITKSGLKMEDVRKATTFYYQDPQPQKMVDVLKVLVTVNEFRSDKLRFPIIAHIFTTAAYSDKAVLDKMVVLKDSLSGDPKVILENMIKEAQNFHPTEIDTSGKLDLVWSEFSATGKPEPVMKIINLLSPTNAQDMNAKALSGLAQWTIISNAKQHPRVHEIVKDEASKATGELKGKLEQILKDADKK